MSRSQLPSTDGVSPALTREVGMIGATMMGLGSIVGTGVFVSIGLAAGVTGPAVVIAIAVAAGVAIANGLSSAQLAANHPVSGGTYEYGYRWLGSRLGFTAGWMFLCAKSASAATAALGCAGYLLRMLGHDDSRWLVPLALAIVLVLTLLVASGIRRSTRANMVIVSITVLSLLLLIVTGLPAAFAAGTSHLMPWFDPAPSRSKLGGLLEATALMFVAYTGYGRIATLAEEVQSPATTIPRAIILSLLISMLLYIGVALVLVTAVGSEAFAEGRTGVIAPLELAAARLGDPMLPKAVAIGAITAMVGVLLNLILGLSRVVLAMARRGEMPSSCARIANSGTPLAAVLLVASLTGILVMVGNVKSTWSFSAFTVLIYHAITNLAATRLTRSERLYPRWVPWVGLLACLFLAFWVEPRIWLIGLALIGAGLVWQSAARMLRDFRQSV